jgi:uncharacterized repeat protein (TIGR01451 family)
MFRMPAAIRAVRFSLGVCVATAGLWALPNTSSAANAATPDAHSTLAAAAASTTTAAPKGGKFGADIALQLSAAPETAEAGETVIFTADITNDGPQTANNVGFSLELPEALSFVGLAPESSRMAAASGEPWACALKNAEVQCMMSGQIVPPGSAPVLRIETVVVEGAALGPVDVIARASSIEGDNWPENNVATATVTITGIIDPVYEGDFECAPGRPDCPRKAGVFTTRESFIAAIPPGYYEEDFAGLQEGTPLDPLPFSGAGISYELLASRPWDPTTKTGGLFTWPGIVSTNSASDAIVITVTDGQMMAIGANFYSSDIHSTPVDAEIEITLSDGTVETFLSTSRTDFRGFVGEMPITRIEIRAAQKPWPLWPTMENLIVSQ